MNLDANYVNNVLLKQSQIRDKLKTLMLAIKQLNSFPHMKSSQNFHLLNSMITKMITKPLQYRGKGQVIRKLKNPNVNKMTLISELNYKVFEFCSITLYQLETGCNLEYRKGYTDISPAMKQSIRNKMWFRNNSTLVIEKPNISVDNSYNPFIPHITCKPNSIAPLSEWKNGDMLSNPYRSEIELLPYNIFEQYDTSFVYHQKYCDKNIRRRINDFPCKFIDTKNGLLEAIRKIKNVPLKVIAVDLEHHHYRSFMGFTCIIQLSTCLSDYIIDGIECRSFMNILNVIMTDPSILKVFHGCGSDISWLQKDFGVFVVNNFDTQVVANYLGYKNTSFSYLLERLFDVRINKDNQLADWRSRPLEQSLIDYARIDTHYLLFLYEKFRIIWTQDFAKCCMGVDFTRTLVDRCRAVSFEVFKKPDDYKVTDRDLKEMYDIQAEAFIIICKWRDQVARKLDESLSYVMPLSKAKAIAMEIDDYDFMDSICGNFPSSDREILEERLDTMKQEWQDYTY